MEKEEFQKMLDAQTFVFQTQMDEVKATLAPIAKVYASAQGFGSVVTFIFKSLIVPASILIGIIISLKEVFTATMNTPK